MRSRRCSAAAKRRRRQRGGGEREGRRGNDAGVVACVYLRLFTSVPPHAFMHERVRACSTAGTVGAIFSHGLAELLASAPTRHREASWESRRTEPWLANAMSHLARPSPSVSSPSNTFQTWPPAAGVSAAATQPVAGKLKMMPP